jgi:hypothetical protein
MIENALERLGRFQRLCHGNRITRGRGGVQLREMRASTGVVAIVRGLRRFWCRPIARRNLSPNPSPFRRGE